MQCGWPGFVCQHCWQHGCLKLVPTLFEPNGEWLWLPLLQSKLLVTWWSTVCQRCWQHGCLKLGPTIFEPNGEWLWLPLWQSKLLVTCWSTWALIWQVGLWITHFGGLGPCCTFPFLLHPLTARFNYGKLMFESHGEQNTNCNIALVGFLLHSTVGCFECLVLRDALTSAWILAIYEIRTSVLHCLYKSDWKVSQ